MNGCIYKITELSTGKIYIGQTHNIAHRKAQYRYMTKSGDPSKHKQREFVSKLIGKDFDADFVCEVIEDNIVDQNDLNDREIYWIKYYNATDPRYGYNVHIGGNSIGYISNGVRNMWKMQSKRKRGIIAYDTKKNRCILCMSCASAATVFDFKSAECLATNIRKMRRIKSARYFLYYTKVEYEMNFIREYVNKRLRTIDKIRADKTMKRKNAHIVRICKYVVACLTNYLSVLSYIEMMQDVKYTSTRKEIQQMVDTFALELSRSQR